MLVEDERYQQLFKELESYEKNGIPINMGEHPVSPQQIVTAYMVKEEGTYMRDYIINPNGKIEKIIFHKIK